MATHLDTPLVDDQWNGEVILTDDTHRSLWLWYGFNLRLIAVPITFPWTYDYGWCYRRDVDALLAHVRVWDPDTQDEPPGWHKRPPTGRPRRAPHRDASDPVNAPRCEHGAYLGTDCHDPHCRSMPALRQRHPLPLTPPDRSTT